jgi:hypothetical protein
MAPFGWTAYSRFGQELDPIQFDAAAEQQILQLTDDFLDKVVNKRCACRNTGVARLWMCKTVVSFGQAMEYRIPGLGPPLPKKPISIKTAVWQWRRRRRKQWH